MDMLTQSDDRNGYLTRRYTVWLYQLNVDSLSTFDRESAPKAVSYSAQPVCIISERCCQVFSGRYDG